jgi:GT2 family glycosyltransferase
LSARPGDSAGPPDLSIVIVNWNTRGLLEQCLRSLFDHLEEVVAEVIVVDNASSDGSRDMVRSEFPTVRLVANDSNLGFAAGVNRGLAVAQGELVLLLNSDTIAHPGAIPGAVQKLHSEPSIGVLGIRLLNEDGTIQTSAHPHPFPWRALSLGLAGAIRGRDRRDMEPLPRPVVDRASRPEDVDYVKGAFLLLRQEVLHKVGPLDERFFMYCEEADLCYRARRAGWRVVIWPGVAVTHLAGGSTGGHRLTAAAVRQRLTSRFLFVAKHRPAAEFAAYLSASSLATLWYGLLTWTGRVGEGTVRARMEAIRKAVASYGQWTTRE